jgi:magnesium transporter
MPLDAVRELLRKQRIVDGTVHGQRPPSRHVVETLLHRQQLVELEQLLGTMPAAEIAGLLEALPRDDAQLLWTCVSAERERERDVLWELPDALREQLAGAVEPAPESQVNAFELVDGRLRKVAITGRKALENIQPIWIDLLNASAEKRDYIGEHFGVELPDPRAATDLEVTSRFRIEENDDIHLHSNFLLDREGNSRSVPVAFILHQGMLFSLRNDELPVFRLQRLRARRPGFVEDCHDLLIDLYGADVEYCADSLEDIYRTLSRVGKQVLSETMSDQEAAAVLADIAEEEDMNGRIRSNILDTQRALAFLVQNGVLSRKQLSDTRQILRNIESLNSHTAFLFDKINFLMDATIGFININQNRRVNQLTVFGVVFMPINIIAGIGGMSEFSMMTQRLPWPLAYGGFVIGMGLIGWTTYVALKHFEKRKLKRA